MHQFAANCWAALADAEVYAGDHLIEIGLIGAAVSVALEFLQLLKGFRQVFLSRGELRLKFGY